MNKLIIGLNSPCNEPAIAAWLVDKLGLCCINIQQPILAAAGALLGVEAYDIDIATASENPQAHSPTYRLPVSDIVGALRTTINTASPNGLITNLHENLQQNEKHNYLFSGTIIRGITTEKEAQAVRDMGGVMVYIRTGKPHTARPHPDDIIMHNWRDERSQYKYISDALRAYRDAAAA